MLAKLFWGPDWSKSTLLSYTKLSLLHIPKPRHISKNDQRFFFKQNGILGATIYSFSAIVVVDFDLLFCPWALLYFLHRLLIYCIHFGGRGAHFHFTDILVLIVFFIRYGMKIQNCGQHFHVRFRAEGGLRTRNYHSKERWLTPPLPPINWWSFAWVDINL